MLKNIIKTYIIDHCVNIVFDKMISSFVIPHKIYIGRSFKELHLHKMYDTNARTSIFYNAEIIELEHDEEDSTYEYTFVYDTCKITLVNGDVVYSLDDMRFDGNAYDVYDDIGEFSFIDHEVDLDNSF